MAHEITCCLDLHNINYARANEWMLYTLALERLPALSPLGP